jgi:hypothetical protein
MTMRLRFVHTLPDYRNKVQLQWTIDSPDPAKTQGVSFTVLRSGTRVGEWDTIAEGLTTIAYTDTLNSDASYEVNLLSLHRRLFYKVVARLSDGSTLETDPTDIDGNKPVLVEHRDTVGYVGTESNRYPSPASALTPSTVEKRVLNVSRKLIRDYLVALRLLTGREVVVLKRRQFGKRCDACYNRTVGVVITTHCAVCYGTSWEGGYYTPIPALAKVTQVGEQTAITTPETTIEAVRGVIEMIAFPRLGKDDVIVDLDTNDRWRVEAISTRSLRGRIVKQDMTCEKVARTSVIYSIPADVLVETPNGYVT